MLWLRRKKNQKKLCDLTDLARKKIVYQNFSQDGILSEKNEIVALEIWKFLHIVVII